MCVRLCECAISVLLYIFVFAGYLLVLLYVCAQIRVWSCFITENLGLFTGIVVCKFLRGLAAVRPETFLFCPLYALYIFWLLLARRIVR